MVDAFVVVWRFLFSRDAPKESNDVSTIPKQAADADNCSLECQATWAETAATPKPRKLRPGNKKGRTSLEAETALSLFGLKQPRIPSDLGRNSLDADTAPKQLLHVWRTRRVHLCDLLVA